MRAVDQKQAEGEQLHRNFQSDVPQNRRFGAKNDDRFSSRYFRLQRRRNNFYIAGAIAVLLVIIAAAWFAYDDLSVELDKQPNTVPVLVERGPPAVKNNMTQNEPFILVKRGVSGDSGGKTNHYAIEHSRSKQGVSPEILPLEIPPLVLLSEEELSRPGAQIVPREGSRVKKKFSRVQRKISTGSPKSKKYRRYAGKTKITAKVGHRKTILLSRSKRKTASKKTDG